MVGAIGCADDKKAARQDRAAKKKAFSLGECLGTAAAQHDESQAEEAGEECVGTGFGDGDGGDGEVIETNVMVCASDTVKTYFAGDTESKRASGSRNRFCADEIILPAVSCVGGGYDRR